VNVDRDIAALSLRGVAVARAKVRSDLSGLWFPLILFGAITLGSVPAVLLAPGEIIGAYWTVLGIVGGVATGVFYQRRERSLGVSAVGWPYIATALAIMCGALLTGWYGGLMVLPALSFFGPVVVVALGYLVFAWLERAVPLAAMALGLLGATAAVWLSGIDPRSAGLVLAVLYGATFVVTGVLYALVREDA